MHFSITELLLIAFIVLILFGTKKLRNIGQDLGGAVAGFKDGVKEGGITDDKSDSMASLKLP